jgi:hypothetical protein
MLFFTRIQLAFIEEGDLDSERQLLRKMTEQLITQLQREIDYHRDGVTTITLQVPFRGGKLRDHVQTSCITEQKLTITREKS